MAMLAKIAILDQTAVPVASKGLDAYALRGRAIAANLANVTTPGYSRLEVRFEDELREALDKDALDGRRTHPGHMMLGRPELDQVRPEALRVQDPTQPGEINNVDVDLEAAKMAENSLMYNFAVKFIRERMDAVQASIKGTGR